MQKTMPVPAPLYILLFNSLQSRFIVGMFVDIIQVFYVELDEFVQIQSNTTYLDI